MKQVFESEPVKVLVLDDNPITARGAIRGALDLVGGRELVSTNEESVWSLMLPNRTGDSEVRFDYISNAEEARDVLLGERQWKDNSLSN